MLPQKLNTALENIFSKSSVSGKILLIKFMDNFISLTCFLCLEQQGLSLSRSSSVLGFWFGYDRSLVFFFFSFSSSSSSSLNILNA